MATKTKEESVVVAFLRLASANANLSRTQHESEMRSVLSLAIRLGMPFEPTDFQELSGRLVEFGADGGEHYFTLACEHGNRSACSSYEAFVNRKPFMYDGKRLHVGAEMRWENTKVRVTSFDKLGEHIVACSYKPRQTNGEYQSEKVDKRFTITLEELRAGERIKRPPPSPENVKLVKAFRNGLFWGEGVRRAVLKLPTLKDAWGYLVADDEQGDHWQERRPGLNYLKQFLGAIGYTGAYATVEAWKTKADLRRDVDYDRDVGPLLTAFLKRKPDKPDKEAEEEEAEPETATEEA